MNTGFFFVKLNNPELWSSQRIRVYEQFCNGTSYVTQFFKLVSELIILPVSSVPV